MAIVVHMEPNWERNIDMKPVLTRIGSDILEDARRYVPVSNIIAAGYVHLREDLDFELINEGAFGGVRIGSKTKEYSIYVELGTSKMGAQPYLRPALERSRSYAYYG